jgi:hypothetical protein
VSVTGLQHIVSGWRTYYPNMFVLFSSPVSSSLSNGTCIHTFPSAAVAGSSSPPLMSSRTTLPGPACVRFSFFLPFFPSSFLSFPDLKLTPFLHCNNRSTSSRSSKPKLYSPPKFHKRLFFPAVLPLLPSTSAPSTTVSLSHYVSSSLVSRRSSLSLVACRLNRAQFPFLSRLFLPYVPALRHSGGEICPCASESFGEVLCRLRRKSSALVVLPTPPRREERERKIRLQQQVTTVGTEKQREIRQRKKTSESKERRAEGGGAPACFSLREREVEEKEW